MLTQENFNQSDLDLPIGKLPENIAQKLDMLGNEIYMSADVFAKIRDWIPDKNGHPEISKSDFYLLPILIQNPSEV